MGSSGVTNNRVYHININGNKLSLDHSPVDIDIDAIDKAKLEALLDQLSMAVLGTDIEPIVERGRNNLQSFVSDLAREDSNLSKILTGVANANDIIQQIRGLF